MFGDKLFDCIVYYGGADDWCEFGQYTMFWGLYHEAVGLCWDSSIPFDIEGEHYIF